ncbi:MAG: hypothetical protein IKU62_08865 [Ruminiclostridium sp.]|nr:hypothetical protein [Ruminiclostridium sp.]
MNNERFEREIESIAMPEDMKARILANCHHNQREPVPEKKRKAPWKVVLVAAVLVVCAVPVLAGQGNSLQNPTILPDGQAVQDACSQLDSYSLVSPNSGTPHSLEKMTESRRMKWDGWASEDTMGGTVVMSMTDWTGMKVLEADGPVKAREVYEKRGGVKTEYAAENPVDLQGLESGAVAWDLTWMNENYACVSGADFFYRIEDRWGNLLGEHCTALYATQDEQAWFSLEWTYDSTYAYDGTNTFVAESDYDLVYEYTTVQGHTFLLQFYGDCVWAECITTHAWVSLYGGYLEPDQVEELLDNLSLTGGG